MKYGLIYTRLSAIGAGLLFSIMSTGVASAICPPPDTPIMPLLDTSIIRMDLNHVPTGILEDFGETPINLDAFDGVSTLCDSNYVNFRTLNGILAGLSSSRISNGLTIPSDITEQMSQLAGSGNNPVGIVAYKYNRTYEFAVANHLLDVVDGQYYDVYDPNGGWVNPYEEKYVVAFSPYMNVAGSQVTYSFRSSLLFSNLSITSILFNAGDGMGFREIGLGNNNVLVTYSNPNNPVELKLRITLSGGQMLETHSFVTVLSSPTSSSNPINSDECHSFSCDSTYLGYTEPVNATMNVKYGIGHSSLVKPLIIAEGFDPFSDPDGLLGTDGTGRGFSTLDEFNNLLSYSNLDYDLVYIDWHNSYAPIQANAEILKKVITWVNTHKTSTEKSILIGQSMGGLIARYALRSMELAGIPHEVKVYVSDDAPHYGVNVPVGYTYALQSWLGDFSIINSPFVSDLIREIVKSCTNGSTSNADIYINEVFKLREAPSVKQMLMHYISTELEYNSQMYNAFQDTLNMFGFPQGDAGQKILNLTISNGGQNTFSSNTNYLFHFDARAYAGLIAPVIGWICTLLSDSHSIVPGIIGTMMLFSGPRVRLNVYPNYPGTERVYDYSITWEKQRGLFQGEIVSFKSDFFDAPSNSRIYDSDAGSFYSLRDSNLTNHYYGENIILGGYNLEYYLNNRFMFVPSVSSLAYKKKRINLVPTDRTIDFASVGIDMEKIPFDGYRFARDTSTYHTYLYPTDIVWVDRMADLRILPSSDTLLTGSQLSLNDSSLTVLWSIADNSVATINPTTGIITKVLGGTTTAYADITLDGGHVRLAKDVYLEDIPFPGFPTYVLSQTPDPVFGDEFNGDYTIEATPSFIVDQFFIPYLTCHWGVKENHNSTIQWSTTPYVRFVHGNVFFCHFSGGATARRVYFYVSYRNQVSPTYSVFCRVPPSLVVLDGEGNLYTEDMENPFAQVKGDLVEESFTFTCLDKTLIYDHWPTWAEFVKDMLNSEQFMDQVKTLKPWGEEETVLIPYSYHTDVQDIEEYGVITVRYDDSL